MPEAASYPTPRQRQLLWSAVTGLAITVLAGVIVLFAWLFGQFLKLLYPVLLPLGFAAIIAFILEPGVAFLERRGGLTRPRAIFTLFSAAILGSLLFGMFILPSVLHEIMELVRQLPEMMAQTNERLTLWLNHNPDLQTWAQENLGKVQAGIPATIPKIMDWAWLPVKKVFAWVGLALGFLFTPLYIYYFLKEKNTIEREWKEYIPLQKSWWKDEVVLILSQINKYLVVFFRGQVLVGACIGVLTGIGLGLIGLPYALLIGLIAGVLSIIPYLGIISSLLAALLVAWVHSGGWSLPLAVLAVFAIVQFCEGFFITPRIIGDSTGLHPLTVILGIMVWSLLLPGLLGPIFAVPLTATLRVLMHRYVWLRAVHPEPEPAAPPG
jgi:predicted PurR-regulated permease PerM